jgi:class 3 adenylate cyclase
MRPLGFSANFQCFSFLGIFMKLECLTIVFVDIKGYTIKTSGQSRRANELLLARFAGLVKPVARAFNGTVVKAIGDAFLMTFKSPTDSLLCAMAVQDQLARRNTLLPENEQFELRFAINAGEVRIDKKDVFGEAVNIAARIEGLAKGGEIYFSEAVYLMMNKSEIPFEEVGRHKLKGIEEAVRVFRVPRLSEVGAYKLARPEESADAAAQAQALPYGGLALKRVNTRMTGMAMEMDGCFHFGGALSEIHYAASGRMARTWDSSMLLRLFAPLQYALLFLGGLLSTAFSPGTYRGLKARAAKVGRQFRESGSFRVKIITTFALIALVAGAAFFFWQREKDIAEQAQKLQAMAAEAQLAKERELAAQKAFEREKTKFNTTTEHARAREAAAKKALEKEKERNKFHMPWQ